MNAQPDETMNLLNEASTRFPEAISFMAGRPPDISVDARPVLDWLHDHAGANWCALGQYSATNGTVRDSVAAYLRGSGLGQATPDACLISNGAQEALAICLLGLVGRGQVAYAPDPCYVGFSGAARALGVTLETGPDDDSFVDVLEARLRHSGPLVACVYVVPDFSNPMGRVMRLEERQRLLELALRHHFHIIEDAAYRHFRYHGSALPTIKQLDRSGHVLYVESFAKTVLPALRLAVLLADRRDAHGVTLADRLAWIKSYLSVATSPLNQGMLAGLLAREGHSLARWIAPRRELLAANCREMCAALERHLAPLRAAGVGWSVPEGGFFMTLDLPFEFDTRGFLACASEHAVLAMPMQLFSHSGRGRRQMRLSFSNPRPGSIDEGVARLVRFIARQLTLSQGGRQ